VPDESTVCKNYAKQYDLTIENIRDKIQDTFVWISVDCEGRFIENVIVGSLNKKEQSSPYFVAVEQFETTNSFAVSDHECTMAEWHSV
jgi:hypothetical protein